MTANPADWPHLYLVLDPDACVGDPVETARAAIGAGGTCLQLRWKSATDREIFAMSAELSDHCRWANVPFIVNDRVDIALAAGANGVHLGVDDLPVEAAARLGGPDFIVGYSPETDDQIAEAARRGTTYLGIGPFAETTTKSDAGPSLGAAEFHRRRMLTDLPVVAIGGISPDNASAAIAASASGIAVASAITRDPDPVRATRMLLDALAART